MDRERIQRRDFPTGSRGYDPAAVDEHLRRLADEFEARVHQPAPSLADSTSERVREILAAAERGAAELHASAGAEASAHVARVQDATTGMLTKLEALESELTRLLGALRESGERLAEGLADLQSQASTGAAPARPAPDPSRNGSAPAAATPAAGAPDPSPAAETPALDPAPAAAAPAAEAAPDASPPAAGPPPVVSAAPDASPAAESTAPDPSRADTAPESSPAAVPDEPAAGGTSLAEHDSPPLSAPDAPDWPVLPAGTLFSEEPEPEPEDAGARLIALNMALSGTPREDTRAYLAEHYTLPDLEALLDDVYARAGR